jgi:periplasmic copper chaperone A
MRAPKLLLLLAAATLTAGLAACGGGETATAQPAPTPSAGPAFTIRDPWVKSADQGMTAAFGTFVNTGTSDLTVISADSPASPIELHEMAMKDGAMVMKPKEGGIVIKAGTEHKLEPGGDHIMLMDLAQPVKPGDPVTFTLAFTDGTTYDFTAVAKPFTGAEESYAPSMGPM